MNRMNLVVIVTLLAAAAFTTFAAPSKTLAEYKDAYSAAVKNRDWKTVVKNGDAALADPAAATNETIRMIGRTYRLVGLNQQDPALAAAEFAAVMPTIQTDIERITYVIAGAWPGIMAPGNKALAEALLPYIALAKTTKEKMSPDFLASLLKYRGRALFYSGASPDAVAAVGAEAVASCPPAYAFGVVTALKLTNQIIAVGKGIVESASPPNAAAIPVLAKVAEVGKTDPAVMLWAATMLEKFGYAFGDNPALKTVYETMNPYYLPAADVPAFKASLRRAAENIWKADQTNEARKALAAAIVSYTDGMPAGK